MRLIVIAIVLLLAFTTAGYSHPSDNTKGNLWSIKFDGDLGNAKISADGKHMFVYHEDSLLCLNARTGARVWMRTYEKVYEYQHLVTLFINENMAVVPSKTDLIFVEVATGKEIGKVRVIGDMGDILFKLPEQDTDYDTLQPTRYGDILVVWYGDGTQVIDLVDKKVLYQSEDDPSKLKIEKWFSTMMLYTHSDTTIFIDGTMRKIVYLHDGNEVPMSADVHQRFFEYKDKLAVFNETNIAVIDKNTAKKIGTILVNPEETSNHFPIVKDDKVYFVASLDDKHELYDVATQKRLWSIPTSQLKGILDQATVMSNGDLLFQVFDEDDNVYAASVDFETGKVNWNTKLVKQDGAYEPGHIKASTTLATIGSYVAASMLNRMSSTGGSYYYRAPYSVGPGGILRYNGSSIISRIDKANLGNETMDGLTSQKINAKRTTEGLFKVVGVDGDNIHLFTLGTVSKAWGGQTSDDKDGEGLVTLDINTGKVLNFKAQPLLRTHEKDDFNLYKHGESSETAVGLVIVGASAVCHATNKGELSTLTFPTEDVTKLQATPNYTVIYFEDRNDRHHQWYIDCSRPTLTASLMYLSDVKCAGVTPDTTVFHKSLTLFDNTLSAYPLLTSEPTSTTKPDWQISEKEWEGLKLGSLDADSVEGAKRGIRIYKDNILLLGDDGSAFVDQNTGACRVRGEWDPTFKYRRDGVVLLQNAVAYQSDSEIGVVTFKDPCSVKYICRERVSHDKCHMLIDKSTGIVIVANYDDNTLNAYTQ